MDSVSDVPMLTRKYSAHQFLQRLKQMLCFKGASISMFINYSAVQNMIYDTLRKKYGKDKSDKISV